MSFQDHFSTQAVQYAERRPRYPAALFAWLAERSPARARCWDAGCGNGQAAVALAGHFDAVIATDPSVAQIAAATPHPRITYRAEPAESPSLDVDSVDLITVAQAYHWLDHARFAAAAERVLRSDGLLAVWCYGLCRVDPAIDAQFMRLYDDILGADWPPERVHVENGYRDLPLPFEPIASLPGFAMEVDWTCTEYLGYLRTWSAVQRYQKRTGEDPVGLVEAAIRQDWGDASQRRSVCFPLSIRVSRKTLRARFDPGSCAQSERADAALNTSFHASSNGSTGGSRGGSRGTCSGVSRRSASAEGSGAPATNASRQAQVATIESKGVPCRAPRMTASSAPSRPAQRRFSSSDV